MSTDTIVGPKLTRVYESIMEFADDAEQLPRRHPHDATPWTGDFSFEDALHGARMGWSAELNKTMELADSAVRVARTRRLVDAFDPILDVSGSAVDVGRFVTGEPECMISYPLSRRSTVGSVVTLAANVMVSGSVSADHIKQRGGLIVALAMLLGQLGHGTELWVSMREHSGQEAPDAEVAIKVKGVDDVIDPAVIMFAFAHPAMTRQLAFNIFYNLPGAWGSARNRSGLIGMPKDPSPDLYPEEAILLDSVCTPVDLDAEAFLRKHLATLGLLAD